MYARQDARACNFLSLVAEVTASKKPVQRHTFQVNVMYRLIRMVFNLAQGGGPMLGKSRENHQPCADLTPEGHTLLTPLWQPPPRDETR